MILRSSSDLVPEKVQQAQESYFLSEILFPNKYSHGGKRGGGPRKFFLLFSIVLKVLVNSLVEKRLTTKEKSRRTLHR